MQLIRNSLYSTVDNLLDFEHIIKTFLYLFIKLSIFFNNRVKFTQVSSCIHKKTMGNNLPDAVNEYCAV